MIESWDAAGQNSIADILRSQLVRSLIATGDLGSAESIVSEALERLGEKPLVHVEQFSFEKVHSFVCDDMRMSRQWRNSTKPVSAKAGNRREEVALHRIAHAGLDQGDIEPPMSAQNKRFHWRSGSSMNGRWHWPKKCLHVLPW